MLAIFYYKETMNDTMSIIINNNKPTKIDNKVDYSIIYHDDVLVGINLFNVSKKIVLPNGFLHESPEILDLIKSVTKMDLSKYAQPKFIVGKIDSIFPIKNTNLNLCKIFNGYDQTTLVCGANNIKIGDKIVLANIGATLPSGLIINSSKIMDIQSNGMLCSKKELFNTDDSNEGVLILSCDYKVGDEFVDHYKNTKVK